MKFFNLFPNFKVFTVLFYLIMFWCNDFPVNGLPDLKDSTSDSIPHSKNYFMVPYVEDFPVLAADEDGQSYLAVLERLGAHSRIGIFKILEDKRVRITSLELKGSAGLGRPALVGLKKGILAAFSARENDYFNQLYYVKINQKGKKSNLKKIDSPGVSNILPRLARHADRICLVWENNANHTRNICQTWIDGGLNHSSINILSSPNHNNNNPDVAALSNGNFFAAWDSFREGRNNIYGAFFKKGKWEQDFKVTNGSWIEKHVSLAIYENETWLCWQAQSFEGNSTLKLPHQHVYIAKLGKNRDLETTSTSFERGISRNLRNNIKVPGRHMRPNLCFSPTGKLILTTRHSINFQDGWYPVMWIFDGKNWSSKKTLYDCQGRWRPIDIIFGKPGVWAAVQIDNIPGGFGVDHGDFPAWKSEIQLIAPDISDSKPLLPFNLKPFTYPEFTFDTRERMTKSNANQERQVINFNGKLLKLYFGNLHAHSSFSVCMRVINPPANDLFAIDRDLNRLDFVALTDHGYNIDYPIWRYMQELVSQYFDPGKFVTFLGEEWTSQGVKPQDDDSSGFHMPKMDRYGHHNIIFQNPNFDKFYDSRDGNISPADITKDIGEKEDFIIIPHQLADWKHKGRGNPPVDWQVKDEVHTPLAEIYQARGSYEYLGAPKQAKDGAPFRGLYLQDAWERGVIIGAIASPDHTGGRGYVGVWAKELTRQSLFEAFHARHTFGTTGEKIALFFASGNNMMGDKVERKGKNNIEFMIIARSHIPISELVIFRNNKIVYQQNPGIKNININWIDNETPGKDRLWYYVRIQSEEGYLAWSSPIWFFKKMPPLQKFKPEHYTGIQNIGHSLNHGEAHREYKTKKIKHGEKGYKNK